MSSFKQNQKLGPATTFALHSYFPSKEAAFIFMPGPCDLWSTLDRWDSRLAAKLVIVPPPEIRALSKQGEKLA